MRWLLIALLLVVGCAYGRRPSHWPSRGPFITACNNTAAPIPVVQHSDGRGGITVTSGLDINRCITFRWAFIDNAGMLLAGPWMTMVFRPWEGEEWCWMVQESEVRRGRCG